MIKVELFDLSATFRDDLSDKVERPVFSTRLPGGFYMLTFELKMPWQRGIEWLLKRMFWRVVISDGEQVLWEGRLEDIEPGPGYVRVTAYGYYSSLSDGRYYTAYNDVWSTVLGAIITAACPAISSQVFTATDRVANSAAGADWLDKTPMEYVQKFLPLSDSTNSPWDFAVWEDRIAYLTKRAVTAVDWTCSMGEWKDLRLRYVGKKLYNNVYTRYQAGGALTRTAEAGNAASQAKYGVTRTFAIEDQGAIAAQEANTLRDALLAKCKDLWPVFSSPPVLGELVRDAKGAPMSSSWVRAGHVIRVTDLIPDPTLVDSVSLNAQNTFFITETEYDMEARENRLTFDGDPQNLTAILARQLAQ